MDEFAAVAVPLLRDLLDRGSSPEARVHALWALFRLGEVDDALTVRMSQDKSPLVRTHVARMLAERDGWSNNADILKVVRGLCRNDDAFVRRAAVDAWGREPRPEAIPFLLSLLEETPAEDTHLRHTIRLALRNQLRDGEHAARELLAMASGDDLHELMSISLAVPSEASAGFLAAALPQCDQSPAQLLDSARHIARYGTEGDLKKAMVALEDRFDGDLSRQHQVMLTLREGFQQRGAAPSDFVRQQAAAYAREFLHSEVEETLPWHTLSTSGAAIVAEPWTVETRRCADGRSADLFSTLPRGERVTGIHRSAEFVLPKRLSFYVAGHCGFPARACHGRNLVRLLDADTGQIIAEAVAPRNDIAQEVVWDLGSHAGRRGYLELVDGDAGTAYAWLAVGRFSLDRLNPQGFSPLDAAIELTSQYRLTELTPELRGLLRDASESLPRRTAAARALIALDQDARLRALISFAADPRIGDRLQSEILSAVDTRDAATIEETLAALVQSLPASEQEACAKVLCGDRAGGEALFKLIETGKASRWLLLDETLKRQLVATRVRDVQRRLRELTRGLPSVDEQIAGQIAEHRRSFNLETASPTRGREVFEKHCAACHRIGETGSLIAPQLDGVGLRGIDRLLEDILDPNRNVDAAFQTTTIVTDDGKVLTGLFRRKEGETLVFADQKGQEFSVPADEIEEQVTSPVSLMPANFTDLATPEQIDDLLAFLLEQRTPVEPK